MGPFFENPKFELQNFVHFLLYSLLFSTYAFSGYHIKSVQDKPVWEAGIFSMAFTYPHYRGSGEYGNLNMDAFNNLKEPLIGNIRMRYGLNCGFRYFDFISLDIEMTTYFRKAIEVLGNQPIASQGKPVAMLKTRSMACAVCLALFFLYACAETPAPGKTDIQGREPASHRKTGPSAKCALLFNDVKNEFSENEEYFGEFVGEPSFRVKRNADGRPSFILLKDFKFKDPNGLTWITPRNWEVDGASIPQFAWSFVGGPLSGNYLHASIIHDKYCDTKERTAHDTHRNFYYGMCANDVSRLKSKVMYWAVRTFGPSWKVVRKKINSKGSVEVKTSYILETIIVNPPVMDKESKISMIKDLDLNLTLPQLDDLSDKIRENLGSEKIQKNIPVLMPGE